ncbi:2Fe-2S iron-sulfur cluster-binding protein [Arenibaculum sp.]|jgi:2Fe-2S ferredoxin|uniref:2Fe-2S iron-sulfur cluster-binding protein n=1 Tax=Arenibaculum sp. TaxID=2865862 RepID=UPI002E0D850A|nr:2Fe-2S iron-sulfur cluster-binding protein [Arenibaculum sp.]
MPIVVYVQKDGTETRVDVPEGTSVMLGAVQNDIGGIEAECGGCCSCATCHVYVDEAFAARLPPPEEIEGELLSGVAAERRPTSRLSCQLAVTAALDGLVVHMPDTQY